MGRITRMNSLAEGSIPQNKMKRASVRKDGRNHVGSEQNKAKKEFNLDPNDIVGWLANKHNLADGWFLYELTPSEKNEFGSKGVYRSYSGNTNSTGIVKVNIEKGTHAWVDNKHYEETDKVKFEKSTAYDRILIEPTDKGYKAFNVEK